MAVEPAEDKKTETAKRLERATYGLVLAFGLLLAIVLVVCLRPSRPNPAPSESSVSRQIAQSAKRDAAGSRPDEPDAAPESADGGEPDEVDEEEDVLFEEDELEPLFPVDEEDGVSLEELAILEDERIEEARAIVNRVTGGLNRPDSGIMFALPVTFADGILHPDNAENAS